MTSHNRMRGYKIYLDVDLVTAEDNGDVLAHTLEIPMPVGNVFVGDPGRDIKHDDAALALDIVSITESTEFLLSCCVPHVEADRSKVGEELQRVNFDTECG